MRRLFVVLPVLMALCGCHYTVVPPVAPCVWLVTASPGVPPAAPSYEKQTWEAENDLKVDGSTVTFTNCYGGQSVLLHGSFSIERLMPVPAPVKPKVGTY